MRRPRGTGSRRRFTGTTTTTTVHRHYDEVSLPEGYLPFADTICCFNPVYGQGMSVAGSEALALRRCLREGAALLDRPTALLRPTMLGRVVRGNLRAARYTGHATRTTGILGAGGVTRRRGGVTARLAAWIG